MNSLLTHRRQIFISLLFVFYLSNTTLAQTEKPSPQPSPPATAQASPTPSQPAANPADVGSIDAIVTAVYDVLSGDKGKKRDWDRMRSLFVPGARLIPSGRKTAGDYGWRMVALEEYITRVGTLLEEQGFFEKEIGKRRTEMWGNIAQSFSAYESRHKLDDPKPFQRGINSFQLINDGTRWWIISVLWQNEDDKTPLPDWLPKK